MAKKRAVEAADAAMKSELYKAPEDFASFGVLESAQKSIRNKRNRCKLCIIL